MNTWTFFEIAINTYQGFLLIYFINRTTHAEKHSIWVDGLSILLISALLSSYLFIEIPFIDTVVFVFPFVHSLFVSKEQWYKKLFWAVILAVITLGTISIVSSLFMLAFDISWDIILGENQYRMSFVIFCNLCLFLVIFSVSRLCRVKSNASIVSFAIFLFFNLLQILSVELLFGISTTVRAASEQFVLIDICLFLASIVSLILYELMANTTFRKQQAEAKLQILQQFQEHQVELKNLYSSMLQYQHDYRHRLNLLEELIRKSEIDGEEKLKLLAKETDTKKLFERTFVTGNIAVDALLMAKKTTMDALGIVFHWVPYPLTYLPIDEMDFCILLANLLDNAIEAIQRLPSDSISREIELKLARSQDMLFIICENDYHPSSIRTKKGKFISSKPNAIMHGYGLESIKRQCEVSNGSCVVAPDNNKFIVRIILPFDMP